MNKALLKQTRVRPSATAEDLFPLLSKVFSTENPSDWLVTKYSCPRSVNGLLDWMPTDKVDTVAAILVLCHGLGEPATKHSRDTLAQLTGLPRKRVDLVLGASSDPKSCKTLLVAAYQFVDNRPELLRAGNGLRAVGLSLQAWHPLARAGVMTVDELCERTAFDLTTRIRGIGAKNGQEIQDVLRQAGRKLKS